MADAQIQSRSDLPRLAAPREFLLYVSAILIFLLSAAITLYFCQTMSGGMEMPGGWTMSMMWMPMPGQPWIAAAAMFLAMWLAMMVAMMLPSAFPMLLMYRRVLHFRGERRAGAAVALMACGYFAVWLAAGAAAYGGGLVIAWATMSSGTLSRVVPIASGALLILCGCYQLTRWKMACLNHCRDPMGYLACHLRPRAGAGGGWRLGLHHGLFCAACCWALMLMQLVLGVMSIAVMVAVAAVIALEKLTPAGARIVARGVGAVAIVGGALMIVRAAFAPHLI